MTSLACIYVDSATAITISSHGWMDNNMRHLYRAPNYAGQTAYNTVTNLIMSY